MGKVQKVRKTVNGVTYVYERTPYYDPKIRNAKYHYRYAGKDLDGEVRKVRSVLPMRSLIYGPLIPILSIIESIGIKDMLEHHLTDEEAGKVLTLAISRVVRPLSMSSVNVLPICTGNSPLN